MSDIFGGGGDGSSFSGGGKGSAGGMSPFSGSGGDPLGGFGGGLNQGMVDPTAFMGNYGDPLAQAQASMTPPNQPISPQTGGAQSPGAGQQSGGDSGDGTAGGGGGWWSKLKSLLGGGGQQQPQQQLQQPSGQQQPQQGAGWMQPQTRHSVPPGQLAFGDPAVAPPQGGQPGASVDPRSPNAITDPWLAPDALTPEQPSATPEQRQPAQGTPQQDQTQQQGALQQDQTQEGRSVAPQQPPPPVDTAPQQPPLPGDMAPQQPPLPGEGAPPGGPGMGEQGPMQGGQPQMGQFLQLLTDLLFGGPQKLMQDLLSMAGQVQGMGPIGPAQFDPLMAGAQRYGQGPMGPMGDQDWDSGQGLRPIGPPQAGPLMLGQGPNRPKTELEAAQDRLIGQRAIDQERGNTVGNIGGSSGGAGATGTWPGISGPASRIIPQQHQTPVVMNAMHKVAQENGVSPDAIAAVMHAESKWRPNVWGGAGNKFVGLWQVGPMNPEHGEIAAGASPARQIELYGNYLRRADFPGQMRRAGIDPSRLSPAQQAAYLQGTQFSPRGAVRNLARGQRATTSQQARNLGSTNLADMTRAMAQILGAGPVMAGGGNLNRLRQQQLAMQMARGDGRR